MSSTPDHVRDNDRHTEFSRRELLGIISVTLLYPLLDGATIPLAAAATQSSGTASTAVESASNHPGLPASLVGKVGGFDDAIADTIQDFSGRQGQGNWHYGYAPSGAYSPQQFKPFAAFHRHTWQSGRMQGPKIGQFDMTAKAGGGESVVRRWQADRTGSVRLVGVLQKSKAGSGTCSVFLNGQRQWTRRLPEHDTLPHCFDILLYDVPRGASVDLVVDSAGRSSQMPIHVNWALQILSETCTAWRPDLPIGPEFTDAQKQAQRQAGGKLLDEIRSAGAKKASTFTIAPGDYRFSGKVSKHPRLKNLQNITLEAAGATFWFEPPLVHGLEFDHCHNVTVKGLTIDCDPLPFFQGRITAIDEAQNPAVHSKTRIVTAQIMPGYEASFFSKNSGHRAVSYYRPDGSYIRNGIIGSKWHRLDGGNIVQIRAPAPGAKVGDYLTCVTRTGQQLRSMNCGGMVYEDCNIYAGGGMAVIEAHGEGGSLYKRVRATRRPGTNRLHAFGADGFHFNSVEKGPVMDRCEGAHFADDEINLHGHFGEILHALAPDHYQLKGMEGSYVPGGRLDFWDFFTLEHLGYAKVAQAHKVKKGWDVKLDRNLDLPSKVLIDTHRKNARDYVIKNCWFHDTGQRFLLNGSPHGRSENNTFQNIGAGICLQSASWNTYTEGAFPDDTIFRNNRMINMRYGIIAKPQPRHPFRIRRHMPIKNMTISGNYIQDAGTIVVEQVDGLVVKDNCFDQPFAGHKADDFELIRKGYGDPIDAPIYLAGVKNGVIDGNHMYDPLNRTHDRLVRLGALTSDITLANKPQWNTIADSISSWWPQPTQGQSGWFYGTLSAEAVRRRRYDVGAFKKLPLQHNNWRPAPGKYPLIEVAMMHPSGDRLAVRRWTSGFAGDVRVEGVMQHDSPHGDGTSAYLFLDGRMVWRQPLSDNHPHHLRVPLRGVRKGSTLDFIVAANKDASYDATRCYFKILTPPKA